METFYDRLLDLCLKKGISVSKLEKELGYSNGSLNRLKEGGTPNIKRIKEIAEFFGTTPNILYNTTKETADDAGYYTDPDVADIAQFAFENPQYKVLFDATKKVRPEDIDFVLKMIDRMTNYD